MRHGKIYRKIKSLIRSEKGAVELVEGSYLYPMAFVLIFVIVFLSIFLMNKAISDSLAYYKFQQASDSDSFRDPKSLADSEGLAVKEHGLMIRQINVENKGLFQSLYPFRYFDRKKAFNTGHNRDINWTSAANDIWHMQAINYLQKSNITGE